MIDDHDACGVALIAQRHGRASYDILAQSLEALRRMSHRGAGDGRGFDGVGILTGIPWTILDADLPVGANTHARRMAGSFMLARRRTIAAIRAATLMLRRAGWASVQWRRVPTNLKALPPAVRRSAPIFMQCVAVAVSRRGAWSAYRTRRLIEARWNSDGLSGCTIASLSERTIVYKALATAASLSDVFRDLQDARYTTPFALVHQRFSTNTLPAWHLVQPFRTIAHNGEINTIRGNRLWARAREADEDALPTHLQTGEPMISLNGSDSQSLDDAVELLRETGHATPRALARLLPGAWDNDPSVSPDVHAFFRHEACFAEPWEGPAALVFADGRHAGAMVDRCGFRPLRTLETSDGLVCIASEAGVIDVPAARVVRRDRLGPGDLLVIDLECGAVYLRDEALRTIARDACESGDDSYVTRLVAESVSAPPLDRADLRRQHQRFGWTQEEIDLIVKPIGSEGHEAVGSMGDDATLAALGTRARPLSDYFRQRFAQVTNPPLDPVRERCVMSLRTLIGRRGAWHDRGAKPSLLTCDSPVLLEGELAALGRCAAIRVHVLHMGFDPASGETGLRAALTSLAETGCALVRNGVRVLVLSDRSLAPERAPIPTLLATSVIDDALRAAGLRLRAGIVIETGEVRDAHQLAILCGFGASAVCPYLLYDTVRSLSGGTVENCRSALESGVLRVMSKLGVCTFDGYVGSRQFDAFGLDPSLTAAYFAGCSALDGNLTLARLASIAQERHEHAGTPTPLPHPGFHVFRRDGDHHAFNPIVVKRLHEAATNDDEVAYRSLAALLAGRPPRALRDLMEVVPGEPIAIDEVESTTAICRRFFASAMSVGALSPEAHRTLAIAMNRLGGRSNSGEGGEEPDRFDEARGVDARSATRQVASARFGVTPAYLSAATELQIKIAQGSKPGEGGQLPGPKVDNFIARLRHAQPGTTLLSPPPHHDIYSIEDLAQLIFDLRAFHPRARINVKLVAQPGIGVVAAGVVKAGADAIQISGHEGGTGASPRGSIKHAGGPWELGLAEAHRTLVACGLRDRVVLQVDGGLQTGRDIVIASALGAEEFGFGTTALVALGCVMARQCHQNTCPVGIATQRPELRDRFVGTPEMVMRYLLLVAQDVRGTLASLGLRRVSDLVGRAAMLRASARMQVVDLAPALERSLPLGKKRVRRAIPMPGELARAIARASEGRLGHAPVMFVGNVRNTDRALGADLAGRLAAMTGDTGTAHAPVEVRLTGSVGQSLWAFALPGMRVRVDGDANDGVGKGMHGGEIVIRPPAGAVVESPVLVGNAALYGATGGRLFVAGRAGERFAVRNSGAWAVVEGVGDHACEYMTGGAVLVLGPTGRNFAAGMTGGVAYVVDLGSERGEAFINDSTVHVRNGLGLEEPWVRAWLVEHHERTASAVAARLLEQWPSASHRFQIVVPRTDWPRGLQPREAAAGR